MSLADYQSLVDSMVRDEDSSISTAQRDTAIAMAVQRYSKDRPEREYEDISGDGTAVLALPADWESGFSKVLSLEYPIQVPPSYINSSIWNLYSVPGQESILTGTEIPAAEKVRVLFTISHLVDGTNDTIPTPDREAVASYASGLLCDQLSSLYSGETDSTISADTVEHRTKAQEFAARARTFRKVYFDALGVDPKRDIAYGTVVNLNMPSSRGRDRITHPGNLR